jgi:hypothetical protein
MSKYISYDAREPRIPIKDPVTGDIYIVGHADFEEDASLLPGIQLLPDWTNAAKYDSPVL